MSPGSEQLRPGGFNPGFLDRARSGDVEAIQRLSRSPLCRRLRARSLRHHAIKPAGSVQPG